MIIALYKPEIPPNTGNIGRLCYCTNTPLHIIGKPAFSLDESSVKRAGLDYWEKLELHLHEDWVSFRKSCKTSLSSVGKILCFTRFAKKVYTEHIFSAEDTFVFGSESKGIPNTILDEIRHENTEQLLRIPVSENCRSLNLSNSVAIILFEAFRQLGFPHLTRILPTK